MIFVTSFNHELYEATGKRLIESFREYGSGHRLLVCGEGGLHWLSNVHGVDYHDLDDDPFLDAWLKSSLDIIPDYLGGSAKECSCPGREKRHAKHKFGCHWQWMNRNASRWFRKVASLLAVTRRDPKPDLVVWLDSDAYFVAQFTETAVRKLLGDAAMFYCRGHRPAVESGIMGFNREGLTLIERLYQRYISGRFRKDERWDDGFQIAKLIDETKDIKTRDLVHPTAWKGKTNDVIPTTALAKYVTHEKGAHGTKLNIMK